MDIGDELYNAALKVQNSRTISPFIDAGGVAAAISTKAGNIYVSFQSTVPIQVVTMISSLKVQLLSRR